MRYEQAITRVRKRVQRRPAGGRKTRETGFPSALSLGDFCRFGCRRLPSYEGGT